MIRSTARFIACLAFVGLLAARPASADVLGLTDALGGNAAAGDLFGLTVSFDRNGSDATNLVGAEIYVAFAGLVPVPGSYQLGSVFAPFANDLIDINGVCADVGCAYPEDDSFSLAHYLSLVSVFAPFEPTGPGTLFTMQFAAATATAWTLNVLADTAYGLLWDPPAQACDPDDLDCDPDPVMSPIPFVIVSSTATVPVGIARINIDLDLPEPPTPAPVPEPATLTLFGTALFFGALKLRRPRK